MAGFHFLNLLEKRGTSLVRTLGTDQFHAGLAQCSDFGGVGHGLDVNDGVAMKTSEGVVLLDLVGAGDAGVASGISHSKKCTRAIPVPV